MAIYIHQRNKQKNCPVMSCHNTLVQDSKLVNMVFKVSLYIHMS